MRLLTLLRRTPRSKKDSLTLLLSIFGTLLVVALGVFIQYRQESVLVPQETAQEEGIQTTLLQAQKEFLPTIADIKEKLDTLVSTYINEGAK